MQFFKRPTRIPTIVSAAVLGGCALFAPPTAFSQEAYENVPGPPSPDAVPVEDAAPLEAAPGEAAPPIQPIPNPNFCQCAPVCRCAPAEGDCFTLNSLLGEDRWFDMGGWTQFGYHDDSTGVFNTHPHRVNLHQQWFWIERVADGSQGLDFGFRFDAVYGVDAQNTQAFGNPPGSYDFMNGFDHGIYGWALPQLYGEVAMGDLSVKAGHFYTIIGYETVTAPDNFFYSKAFTFNFNEPFTHTGVLASYNVSDGVTAYGGWTAGWDTGFERNDDADNSKGTNFLGGLSIDLSDNMNATYATTAGDFGVIGEGYMQSFVLQIDVTENLDYIFQNDWLHTSAIDPDGDTGVDSYSFNQYLFYTISDELAAGARGEIWTVEDFTIYQTTLGVNIRPMSNVVVRPEVRWQWGDDGDERFFENTFGVPTGDTIFGVDAILLY